MTTEEKPKSYRSKPIKAKHLRRMDHQALCEQLEAWSNA